MISAPLPEVLLCARQHVEPERPWPLLIFDDQTGAQIDFDLRGEPHEILARLPNHPGVVQPPSPQPARTGPGRPRLGVVSRELSLLPRHWEWLEQQRGGMSVAVRRLVDEARKREEGATAARRARDAIGKFMWTMAGNLPRFEDASRALYAKDSQRLLSLIQGWPADIRVHIERQVATMLRLDEAAAA